MDTTANASAAGARMEIAGYERRLEEIWRLQDQIFDSLTLADWARKHGKDWTFADVPYHCAYFDRIITVQPIKYGRDLPESEREFQKTMRELNDWNSREFAKRPAGQTPQQSLADLRAVRQEIRDVLAGLTDADLSRPAWMRLAGFAGWQTARVAIDSCQVHEWSHLVQMRLNLHRDEPMESPELTREAMSFYLNIMPAMMDRQAAARKDFTAVMEITGRGATLRTYKVENGVCHVLTERANNPDLVMSQSAETFVKTLNKMHNPMLAMLTGKIKVKGFRKMGTFGKLFSEPPLDKVISTPA